uniref:Uncharacterized protein n=1 Tax=Rhipicephalus zambeziensis TaxID=60191 RepID=A0A224Y6F2_9ACAR
MTPRHARVTVHRLCPCVFAALRVHSTYEPPQKHSMCATTRALQPHILFFFPYMCVTSTPKVSCSNSPWVKCQQCVFEQYPFHILRSCRNDLVRHPTCMVWLSSAAPGSAKGTGAVCGEELMFTMNFSLHQDSVPFSFLFEYRCSALL